MVNNTHIASDKIRSSLNLAHNEFHSLIESVSETGWQKQSLNPGWKNGEILTHILFGFIILNALLPLTRMWGRLPKESSKPFANFLNFITKPFNWVNALGARGQGKVFMYQRIGKMFDKTYASLLSKINNIRADEWQKGMYYPTKWDSNFSDFMTIEKLFLYPIVHFKFHRNQIAYSNS